MVSKTLSARMAPFVWRYIEKLQQKSEHVGTCAGVIRIQSEASASGIASHPCDRFLVAFPFGAQCCKWEVIFDANVPDEPPDFIFNSDQDFLPDYDDLKTLHNWEAGNPDALFDALKELISKFKLHHQKLVEGTRVEFEMLSLTRCEEVDLRGDDLHEHCQHFYESELYVAKKNGSSVGPIQITVKLPIDFIRLSDAQPSESGVHKVLAIVVYENADGGNVATQICPSAGVERVLKSVGGVPTVPFPLEGCLHDYVISVTGQINDQIERFLKSFEKRKQFVLCLTSTFSGSLLEYDATSYRYIHLLVSTETTPALILTIDIPHNFPIVQPSLLFSSTGSETASKTVKDYPYSPRWSPQEMTERLKTFLLQNIPLVSKEIN